MWSVLHENPMADKMVGTLGSILQRKVTEVFSVKKHKHEKEKYPNMPDIWFEVNQPKARGKDQDDWSFEVISAESWGVPVELDQNGRVNDPEAEKTRQFIIEANDRFSKFNWTSAGARYTDLESHLRSQGVTSNRRIKDYLILHWRRVSSRSQTKRNTSITVWMQKQSMTSQKHFHLTSQTMAKHPIKFETPTA
jgi:hypothetical protein